MLSRNTRKHNSATEY